MKNFDQRLNIINRHSILTGYFQNYQSIKSQPSLQIKTESISLSDKDYFLIYYQEIKVKIYLV
jgi:hypothetical protein